MTWEATLDVGAPEIPEYLGLGIDRPSQSLRVLTRANIVVETRGVTWEATLDVGAREILEQRGTQGVEDAPELGGADNFRLRPDDSTADIGEGISSPTPCGVFHDAKQ